MPTSHSLSLLSPALYNNNCLPSFIPLLNLSPPPKVSAFRCAACALPLSILSMADDWDLQAVVRGCTAATSSSSSSSTTTAVSSNSCSPDVYSQSFFQPQEDRFQFFPDPLEPYGRSENVEELHDLFKPFHPRLQSLSPQGNPISSISFLRGLQDLSPSPPLPPPAPPQKEEKQRQKQPVAGTARTIAAGTSIASSANTPSPRSKRRKNQLKRVCQVPAEGLSSDMWSWRKYGQKPIKGSPYPRGYYRCSTSKGCLARKQVERDRSDPGMFIVTYTGEHSHPMPTHRNSLAGSTRQKPVTPQTTTTSEGDTTKPSCSPPVSPTSLSPVTEKVVTGEEREVDLVEGEEDELGVSDMVISDDFFEGLEELNGPVTGDCFPDHLPVSLPFPWMANSATTTAAGGG